MTVPAARCDIFCRVVDNFGDAGVAWRLARQLSVEHGLAVRLVIDDVPRLARLVPGAAHGAVIDGVGILAWGAPPDPADLVIEAFACELPPDYLARMAGRSTAPVWINLEYLSAEVWVDGHHLLPSPHPSLPLVKHFFFPGFTPRTGGLIRERGLLTAREAHDTAYPAGRGALVFAYPGAPLSALRDTLPGAWKLRVMAGAPAGDQPAGVEVLPFCPQAAFDALLWSHDVLFVRGEDSFVRAQWAARPFVWHIYRQQDDAHLAKLAAFLDRYCTGLDPDTEGAVRTMWLAWNAPDGADLRAAWAGFEAALPVLRPHARAWAEKLAAMPDLATNLLSFFGKTAKIAGFAAP